MKKAICRLGDRRMHPQYSHLEKSHDVWFSMSSEDRKVHIQKVLSTPLQKIATTLLPVNTSDCDDADASSTVAPQLSHGYEVLNGKGVHEATLRGIWNKAAQLLQCKGAILPVPGNTESSDRMVASKGGTYYTPHGCGSQKQPL